MTPTAWVWLPESITFNPSYFSHPSEYGKAQHVFRDPFWTFEFNLPPQKDETRRDIEIFLASLEGYGVVEVYDPRCAIPKFYEKPVKAGASEATIPDITVKAVTRSASTLTISGTSGDVVSKGDAIAFTDASGYRHYYKSKETLTLTGVDQTLNVILRPKRDLTAVAITVDRIRATARFVIDPNKFGGGTSSDNLTMYAIKGVEYAFEVTP